MAEMAPESVEKTGESVELPKESLQALSHSGGAHLSAEIAPELHPDMGPLDVEEGAQAHEEGLQRQERYEERRLSRLSAMSGERLSLQDGHLDDVPEPIGDVTLCSSSSGTISQEGEDYSRPRQSAHVAASARALMAADARSAAQAAVDSAELNLKRPKDAPMFRTTSNSTTDTFKSARRRAEEYLAGSSVSQTSQTNQTKASNHPQEDRRKTPTASPGGSGARAWHQGLARQKAEVEASVQDYRRLLLKSLKTLSQVKSALYDADERSMHLGKGAEVMLSEVWDILNSLLQGDLGQAASMQSKAEEEARVHQDLKGKLRVSSAALEVEAALTSCDELRSRIEEVQSRLAEIRSQDKQKTAKSQKLTKAQAHSLIRSFTAILLPRLPDLVSQQHPTAAEATVLHFLQAAAKSQSSTTTGQSALAQARAARGKP